jgi:serine/threonine protein kinase
LPPCRDLKPSNVLLKAAPGAVSQDYKERLVHNSIAKAADLGLLAFSRVGYSTSGTPGYVPPEQQAGRRQTSKVDVFAFALVIMSCM